MNFKKLKRLLSIVLSATMILSTNMTGLAATSFTDASSFKERVSENEFSGARSNQSLLEQAQTGNGDTTPMPATNSETPEESESSNVAMIGSVEYASLSEAIVAASAADATDKTILLTADTTLAGEQGLSGLTIDTQGHMITVQKNTTLALTGDNATLIKNEVYADASTGHSIFNVEEGATLTIAGGIYQTNSPALLRAFGAVTITSGTFTCTASDATTLAAQNYYDGLALFEIAGNSVFTMTGGSINADIGDNGENGMYGMYIYENARLELGTSGQTTGGPAITGKFAAIGTNATTPSAIINIHSGTYHSTVACTGNTTKKFNAVLYLSANSNVIIDGGTFQGNGSSGYIISIPYADETQPWDNTNLGKRPRIELEVKGGTFQSGAATFYGLTASNTNLNGTVQLTGGEYATTAVALDNTENAITVNGKNYLESGKKLATASGKSTIANCDHSGDGKIIHVSRIAPTCWSTGRIAGYECTDCGTMVTSATDKTPVTKTVIIPAKNHDGIYAAAAEATCEEAGHKEYYYCKNCNRYYESMEALVAGADEEGEEGDDYFGKDHFNEAGKNPKNHDYPSQAEAPASYEFDSSAFDPAEFVANDANGVTAIRHCKNDAAHTQEAKTVEVVLKSTPDCTKGGKAVYTATATFEHNETTATATRDIEIDVAAGTHTYTGATIAWKTDAASKVRLDGNKLVYQPGDLIDTAQTYYTCGVCNQKVPVALNDITITVSGRDYNPETQTVACGDNAPITLTATVQYDPNDDTNPTTATLTVSTLSAVKHNMHHNPESLADCDKNGNYEYYNCTYCNKNFWDDSDAPAEIGPDESTTIEAYGHNLGLPKFELTAGTAPTATATFTCINCGKKLVLSGDQIKVGDPEPLDTNLTCTDKTTMSRRVEVTVDKGYVGTSKENADILVYTKTENNDDVNPVTYKQILKEETSAYVGHNFELKLKWPDPAPADGYAYDEENKVIVDGSNKAVTPTAVLTCSRCGGVVEISKDAEGNVTADTPANVTVAGISKPNPITAAMVKNPGLTLTENEQKGIPSTCYTTGKYFADAKATCDVLLEITGETPAKTAVDLSKTTDAATVKMLEHKYEIVGVSWHTPAVAEKDPAYKQLKVKIACANESEEDAITIPVAADSAYFNNGDAAFITELETAPKCTTPGKRGYKILQMKYDTNGDGQLGGTDQIIKPKSANDPTDPSKTVDTEVIVAIAAAGHKYDLTKGAWSWDEYLTTRKAYYEYVCQNADCDGTQTELEGTNNDPEFTNAGFGVKEVNGVTTTVRKIEVIPVQTITKAPTCTENGEGTTTATLELNGKTLTSEYSDKVIPATGHTWDNGTVTWDGWTPVNPARTVEVEVDGKKVSVPDYQVTVTRSCDTEKCTAKESVTGKLSDVIDAGNETKPGYGYIKVTVESYTEMNCTTDRTIVYKAEFFGKPNSKDTAKPVSVATASKTVTEKTTGHQLSDDVVVDWTTLEEEILKNADGTEATAPSGNKIGTGKFTAEASRACSECDYKEKVAIDVNVPTGCGKDEQGAATGPVFEASISNEYNPSDKSNTYALKNGTYTDEKSSGDHQLFRVPEQTGKCGEVAYIAHWHCSVCGKDYKNSDATTEVEVSFEKQSHQFDNPEFIWNVEGKSASATFTCSSCGEKSGVYSAIVGKESIDVPPTCQKTGTAYYPVSVIFKEAQEGFAELRYDDEKAVEVPLVDHVFENGACKWCDKPENSLVKVSYVTNTGVTIREDWLEKKEQTITVPTAPNQSSYQFDHWEVDGEPLAQNATLAGTILEKVTTAGITNVEATAVYTKINDTATVTVAYKGITLASQAPQTVTIGSSYTANADQQKTDKDNKTWNFQHWAFMEEEEDGTEKEVILGYDTAYRLLVQKDVTLYAVYAQKEPEKARPVISITNKYRSLVNDAMKISFTSTMNVPEGYEVMESGMLYTTDKTLATDTAMRVNGSVGQKSMSGTKTNTISFNVKGDKTKTVYTRGYLRFRNTTTSAEEVIYTQIDSGSYETLTDLVSEDASN